MKKYSLLHVLAGIVAVSFALSATGYLAFKEHQSANPNPPMPKPVATSTDSGVSDPGLSQDPPLDQFGFPIYPPSGRSNAFTITEPMLTEEQVDVFLPSSKRGAVDPRLLIEPNQDDPRFLFSSKSLTIREPILTEEQVDVFLPSSKLRVFHLPVPPDDIQFPLPNLSPFTNSPPDMEETPKHPDVFLPSSKVRFIDVKELIDSPPADAPEQVEN